MTIRDCPDCGGSGKVLFPRDLRDWKKLAADDVVCRDCPTCEGTGRVEIRAAHAAGGDNE